MLYNNDITQLLEQWRVRMKTTSNSQSYKDALGDCIYELNNLVNHSVEEELTYQDALHSLINNEAHTFDYAQNHVHDN